MSVNLYLVGGAVRDQLLGIPCHDYDFSVVADGGWDEMHSWLIDNGFTIFVETPEYFTIRAHCPKGFEFAGEDISRLTADFVLARKESDYTDGRRPDKVEPGTLYDDLKRRDFNVNALAFDKHGNLIDYFEGFKDLENGILRAVGNAEDRIREDALRVLRAIRFAITKDFTLDNALWNVIISDWLPDLMRNISVERKQQELLKCFKHDSLETMEFIHALPYGLIKAIFTDGLWLKPTLEK